MKKLLGILISLCLLLTIYVPAFGNQLEQGQLYGKSAVLMDGENGRILYEKNGEQKMPMASTTKIMTCMLALENGNLEDVVTVTDYAASMPKVKLGIRKGEKYRLKDLLYSLMLESHNDVAVAIAEHLGGSVTGFAKMMNQKARDLGAYHTNFVTPNGLDAKDHYTTARDLARIAKYAISMESFIEITNTSQYAFQTVDGKRSFQISNKNAFLTQMEGAIGVKTGFTGDAGYCFVGALERDGRTFISVVLASGWPPNRNYKWADTKKLMNYGLENYAEKQILSEDYVCKEVSVVNGIDHATVKTEIRQEVSLLLQEKDQVEIREKLPESIEAPIKKGQIMGYLEILVNEETYCVIPVYSTKNIERISFAYFLEKVIKRYGL